MSKKGFTLTELLVSLAIIGMLTAIGYTYFSSSKQSLKKEVRVLYNYLIFTRMKAVQSKTSVYMQFDINNNNYSIFYDNGTMIKSVNLSSNTEFGDGGHSSLSNHKVAFGTTNPPKAIFHPDGSCSPSGIIYIQTKNSNNVYKLSVTLAGNVTINKWDGNNFISF